MKSLYKSPIKVAKTPIKQSMYQILTKAPPPILVTRSGKKMRKREVKRIIPPCPMSPNITPNSKGNVMIPKYVGLTSL